MEITGKKLSAAAGLVAEIALLVGRVTWAYLVALGHCIVPPRKKSLAETTALVTGAGRGVGRELARRLASLGVARLVLWDIDKKACEAVAQEIRQAGLEDVYPYKCDVSDPEEVSRVAGLVRKEVGDVTLLINNAGILNGRPFLEMTSADIRRTISINCMGHFWTVRAFLPAMLEKNEGHIVAIASVAGFFGVPYMVDYSTSKFGVRGFMEALEMEVEALGKDGLNFTTICPVTMHTGLADHPKTRFPSLMPVLEVEEAVETMLEGILRNESLVSIPRRLKAFFYLSNCAPRKVVRLVNQFLDYATTPNDPKPKKEESENVLSQFTLGSKETSNELDSNPSPVIKEVS